jgi:hypothetical protein
MENLPFSDVLQLPCYPTVVSRFSILPLFVGHDDCSRKFHKNNLSEPFRVLI